MDITDNSIGPGIANYPRRKCCLLFSNFQAEQPEKKRIVLYMRALFNAWASPIHRNDGEKQTPGIRRVVQDHRPCFRERVILNHSGSMNMP
ncbi:hypothetical protein GALMADRAFT_252969, partial [Galerina marginata CBS 339.88]